MKMVISNREKISFMSGKSLPNDLTATAKNVEASVEAVSNESDSARPNRHTVQSVERTFDVLEALAAARRPVAISELSQQLGLHISTVHRLLATLIERGYARQDERSGRYSIGRRLLELASGLTDQNDIRQEARPALEKLAAQVGETANLSVRNGDSLVYIDQVQTNRLVRMFTKVGSSAPLYCTGSGKLFLAFTDNYERELNRYLLENRLETRTASTLATPQALREELRKVRERGYSFDNEEMEEGVVCVAAPVFDRQGQLVAAISVSGPTSRMLGSDVARVIDPVRASAAEISAALGYKG
jgi:IclR family transcriptional regulator, acetate operon repressor